MKEELRKIRAAFDLLVEQRSSAAIDGKEGENSIIERGEEALKLLQYLYSDV